MNPIIPENNEHGFFKNIKTYVSDNGNVFRTVDTDVIDIVSVGKSKLNDLLPVLRLMAIDWNLNLSKGKDMQIAKLKLAELVKNN